MDEIIYIDQEPTILTVLNASFSSDVYIHTLSSTVEAEKLLQSNPHIKIIFCDQQPQGEQGIDFFQRIKELYPKPIRILMMATMETNTVIDAINRANIFRILSKPWIEDEVISAISEANKFYTANTMLELKNQQLQKAYAELDKFAYTVSHDLREPILSVRAALSLGKEIHDIEKVYELLNVMDASLTSLGKYIKSLGEYYVMRKGELLITHIDFHEIAQNIREFYKISIQNLNLSLSISIKQEEMFHCDRTLIELILHNLLSNAFKYQKKENPNKNIEMLITANSKEAVISIGDNGIGIPPDSIENIFTSFCNASNQAQGTGLGLYSVRRALLKLNGKIEINSEINKGTTVIAHIPSEKASVF
ncbi:histidine kinase [Sphingobacterium sp. Ag1]|uniref:sensor histidine kinase n=1 Tax=Sphingobacterium sp. Ag1 TaxID=1643451 RepID=UPI0006281AAD|nr:hybrid sensor histidine kinase/response regulator [Sphingobacterium sp. Ag1]KKO89251.1 histidine kinase [Sphingobacterium sp. Ag1]